MFGYLKFEFLCFRLISGQFYSIFVEFQSGPKDTAHSAAADCGLRKISSQIFLGGKIGVDDEKPCSSPFTDCLGFFTDFRVPGRKKMGK